MLIIKTDQPNTLVVTVSQNSELTNPEYLFSFTHIFSKEQVNFIPVDISTHKSRYDEFYFVEGSGAGEVNFPYQGQYLYVIYEQPAGSGNLIPSLATNVVENGDAQIFPASASTMDSQYDIYISNNEDNSNIIFAPDEPNPTPNASPIPASPTPTPSITPTNTPTPSVTPTYTPTPSITPTFTPTPSTTPPSVNNPAGLGALWWIDFTNQSTLGLNTTIVPYKVSAATDIISSVLFTVENGDPNSAPYYLPTQYLGVSGATQENASPLVNPMGTYTSDYTGFTWFGLIYDDNVSQAGGAFIEQWEGGFPAGFRTFMFRGDAAGPIPENFIARVKLQSGGDLQTIVNPTRNAWTQIGVRAWEESGNVYLEVWENGSIIGSTSQSGDALLTNTDAEFRLMFDGGIDFNTEQFWFNRKLNNTEMGQMFSYLTAKY